MKTEIEMRRELWGESIHQKSKSGFFSATDLVKAGNKWRIANDKGFFNLGSWIKNKSTLEFIAELEKKYGEVIIKPRGRGEHYWIHPLLFIDLALAISPTLKIEVYEWLFDNLLEFRNDSGDSYKYMCGALWARHRNPRTFQANIKKLAGKIQSHCGVSNWQTATEDQLKRRDELQLDIAKLANVMNNNREAVRLAFEMNRER